MMLARLRGGVYICIMDGEMKFEEVKVVLCALCTEVPWPVNARCANTRGGCVSTMDKCQ